MSPNTWRTAWREAPSPELELGGQPGQEGGVRDALLKGRAAGPGCPVSTPKTVQGCSCVLQGKGGHGEQVPLGVVCHSNTHPGGQGKPRREHSGRPGPLVAGSVPGPQLARAGGGPLDHPAAGRGSIALGRQEPGQAARRWLCLPGSEGAVGLGLLGRGHPFRHILGHRWLFVRAEHSSRSNLGNKVPSVRSGRPPPPGVPPQERSRAPNHPSSHPMPHPTHTYTHTPGTGSAQGCEDSQDEGARTPPPGPACPSSSQAALGSPGHGHHCLGLSSPGPLHSLDRALEGGQRDGREPDPCKEASTIYF